MSTPTTIQLLTLVSSLAASLPACRPGDDGPVPADAPTTSNVGTTQSESSDGDPPPAAPEIAGTWVSPCFAQPDGSFARLDFLISDADWGVDFRVFGDETCTTPLVTVHIEGPYELEGSSNVVDGAWDAVFGFTDKTITPHAEPLVDALTQAGCGTAPWTVDGTQSVAAGGCAAFGQYPLDGCPADHDLVRRDADTLRFGDRPADNDMCAPDKRPSELSALVLELR